jgi:ribonuclease HII
LNLKTKLFIFTYIKATLMEKRCRYICGIDEAGRGPLAGPVVVASVIFKENNTIDGVRDSKKLSEKHRELLYEEIIKNCIDFKIETIDNKTIDKINILNATMLGMEKCLTKLININFKLFIDGNYFKLRNGIHKKYDFETVIGGDDKIFEISCASILAKVTRDRLMVEFDKAYPKYNFAKHKGYGTKMHIEKIREFGLCEIHRETFCRKFLQLSF